MSAGSPSDVLVQPLAVPGEREQLPVNRRTGEAVGQGGQRIGADAEYYVECVLGGVAVCEEGLKRFVTDVTRRLKNLQGEGPDRVQPLVRERLGLAQRGDQPGVGTKAGEPGGVHG